MPPIACGIHSSAVAFPRMYPWAAGFGLEGELGSMDPLCPGSGKTLVAGALPGILREMSIKESLGITRIYSVADQLPAGTPLIRPRPFLYYLVWVAQKPAG